MDKRIVGCSKRRGNIIWLVLFYCFKHILVSSGNKVLPRGINVLSSNSDEVLNYTVQISEGGPSFILLVLYSMELWILVQPFNCNYGHDWIMLDEKNLINENCNHTKMWFRHRIILQYNDWRIIAGKSKSNTFFLKE